MPISQLTPADAQALLKQPGTVLLDVREPWEYTQVHVEGSRHIPMGQVPDRLDELDPASQYVVMCHHGGRSQRVADFLASKGYGRVANLGGGIDAWSLQVDPNLARY